MAFTTAAVGVVMCSHDCRVEPALGGLAFFVSVPACFSGVAIGRSVRRRPVYRREGPAGREFRPLHRPRRPSVRATSWVWLKWIIVAAGIAIAVSAVRSIRAARLTAALAALAWTIGFAWLLADSLGAGLLH